MQTHLPIDRCDGFYTCSSGRLGYGLPAAIGMALGKPHQKAIGIVATDRACIRSRAFGRQASSGSL